MHIDSKFFFEKKNEFHFTTEMPDWYVLEKTTNKITIGMNQLDLWGGQQYEPNVLNVNCVLVGGLRLYEFD